MKCMCAQTRPRFILSSERVFGGMEFEPMLTPREKSPLPENVPRGVSNPRRCGQRAQALPTELFRPPNVNMKMIPKKRNRKYQSGCGCHHYRFHQHHPTCRQRHDVFIIITTIIVFVVVDFVVVVIIAILSLLSSSSSLL